MGNQFENIIDQTSTNTKLLLDQASKKVLLQVPILSRVLKNAVSEFKDYSLSEIEENLMNREEIKTSIHPETNTQVKSDDKEMGTLKNVKMNCDIHLSMNVGKEEAIKIYINIEAQNEVNPRICDCKSWYCLCM